MSSGESGGSRERSEHPPATGFAQHRAIAARALDGGDFDAALASAGRAIACATEETPREAISAARILESEALRWLGDPARAESHALEAMNGVAEGTDAWCTAVGELAIVSAVLSRTERLVTLGEALRDRGPTEPSSALVIASERVASGLVQRGLGALSEVLYERIAAAETAELTPIARARLHQAMAKRALVAGDDAEHLRRTEAAADAFTRARDTRPACSTNVTLGLALRSFGQRAAAERAFREALGLARQANVDTLAATALQNLGLSLADRGEIAEALAAEREALSVFVAQENRRQACGTRVYLATILGKAGEFEEAEREATAVLAELGPVPPIHAHALAMLADILLAQGRLEEALARAVEAFTLLTKIGGVEHGDAQIRLIHAEALHASGRVEAARIAIAEARSRLLARAERIHDPELRAGLLERVPENARTLAAASAWGA